ncbi:hypothetical protein BJX99DRAFT_261605 [Aspergillus californicus]
MGDPFSVSAGVAGVVSLGLTLAQGFLKYYGPWKDFDNDIQGFITKTDGLLQTLQLLSQFVPPENELHIPTDQFCQLVLKNLTSCKEACHRLEKILKECKSSTVSNSPFIRKHDWLRLKRAVYPFKRETLVVLSQLVSGLQDNLSLALQVLDLARTSEQQRRIHELILKASSIDDRTKQILTVVQKQDTLISSSSALAQKKAPTPSIHRTSSAAMPEPTTLRNLCDQQQLINAWLQRKRKSPNSTISQIQHYCSCGRKPWRSSKFSFSVFALHETSCPLYLNGQHGLGIAGSFSFCNRFLGQSIQVMMAMTRGGGALTIGQMIRTHAVVSRDSPAFKLILDYEPRPFYTAGKRDVAALEYMKTSLLRMFGEGKAAATDRLEDGSTLLHELFFSSLLVGSASVNSERVGSYKALVRFLIDAGVPFNEQNIHGETALDTLIYEHTSLMTSPAPIEPGISILREIALSGGLINSFIPWVSGSENDAYFGVQAARSLLPHSPEIFDISDIEMAILIKSKESLHRCLTTINHQPCPGVPTPDHVMALYFLCLGWPTGLSTMLQWHIPWPSYILESCFQTACDVGEVECAMIILEHADVIYLRYLSIAVKCKTLIVLKQVVSALATSRHELQKLAFQHLPREILRSLSIPTNALLDMHARAVYNALEDYGIEVDDPFNSLQPDASVYNSAECEITAFELLYDAGFTDMNQSKGCTRVRAEDTRMDPEEVDEIREEEILLIEELETLVVEFNQKHDELGVGIYEFIFKHWWPRIDEVVPPEYDDPEETRRIRAAGYSPFVSRVWESDEFDDTSDSE